MPLFCKAWNGVRMLPQHSVVTIGRHLGKRIKPDVLSQSEIKKKFPGFVGEFQVKWAGKTRRQRSWFLLLYPLHLCFHAWFISHITHQLREKLLYQANLQADRSPGSLLYSPNICSEFRVPEGVPHRFANVQNYHDREDNLFLFHGSMKLKAQRSKDWGKVEVNICSSACSESGTHTRQKDARNKNREEELLRRGWPMRWLRWSQCRNERLGNAWDSFWIGANFHLLWSIS